MEFPNRVYKGLKFTEDLIQCSYLTGMLIPGGYKTMDPARMDEARVEREHHDERRVIRNKVYWGGMPKVRYTRP